MPVYDFEIILTATGRQASPAVIEAVSAVRSISVEGVDVEQARTRAKILVALIR